VKSWGSFGSGPGQFEGPVDVAVDGSGNVFVSEINGTRIQKFTNDGAYLATIGSVGLFQSPNGIGLDAGGRLYVADNSRNRILRFLANGSFDMEFATPAPPYDVAVGPDGNVYVVEFAGGAQQFSSSGTLLLSFGSFSALDGPFRIAISPAGALYITEQNPNRVMMFQIDQATAASRTTFGRLKAMYR
jgi:DNA-binding beta-propeller fold protein YncE